MREAEKDNKKAELKDKINNLQDELNKADVLLDEKNLQNLEKEKQHLITVKNTILYLKANNELVQADSAENAENLTVRRSPVKEERENGTTVLNKNPALLVLMVISGIIAILFLCAWIEINGYQITLFELAQETESLTYMLGISENTSVVSLLWIMCILQWGFAICYIYTIYSLYKHGESSWIYPLVFGIIIFFIMLWLTALSINSGIDDVYNGLSNYVSAEMTWQAWIALLLAFISGGVYSKQEQINRQFFGINNNGDKVNLRKIPVINYYPWEDVRFTNVILEEGSKLCFSIDIRIAAEWKEKGYSERWQGNIIIKADVVLKIFRKEYVIFNQVFSLEWERTKGITEKLIIEHALFDIK